MRLRSARTPGLLATARSAGALLGLALFALASPARAEYRGDPASLLIFPEFDTTAPTHLVTVTNTNRDFGNGTIETLWIYMSEDCTDFQRSELLTPGDTITVITRFHNPVLTRGYLVVVARDPVTGTAVPFDHLVGTSLVLDAFDVGGITIDPVSFRGINGDLDGDGVYRLDGVEYEEAPAEILIPRFLGQEDFPGPGFSSYVILVDLSGGRYHVATARFYAYNDNEELFSTIYSFACWTRTLLTDVSPLFLNAFLQTTNQDPGEIVGLPTREAGWLLVDGEDLLGSDGPPSPDPAILAVVVSRELAAGAAQPAFRGQQTNAAAPPRPEAP